MNFEEFNKKYAEQVLADGRATQEQIDECLGMTDEGNDITLEDALVSKEVLSRVYAKMITSKVVGIGFIDLFTYAVDPLVAMKADKSTCLMYCCLPIGELFGETIVVTDNVLNSKDEVLRAVFGQNIDIKLAVKDEIKAQIRKHFN